MSIALAVAQWHAQNKYLTRARELGILVDDDDQWLLSTILWYVQDHGHVMTNLRRDHNSDAHVYLHHMIMGCPIWDNLVVDHINRNPLDNRRSNLRWATFAQNLRNNDHPLGQTGMRGTTISSTGKYLSRVAWNGATYHLGTFNTLDEAVNARNEWLAQHGE